MSEVANVEASPDRSATKRLVAKNTIYLTLSQAATVPIAVLINGMTGRYLGAEIFGYIYLASTFASFGGLVVGWGHDGVLPAKIAQDHSVAGSLLGTSFVWRLGSSLLVYAVLAFIFWLSGYGAQLQWALGLTFLALVLNLMVAACKDTIRGFERAAIPAMVHVGQQVLLAALMVPALLLGGGMRTVLLVGVASALLAFFWIARALRPVGIPKLSLDRAAWSTLFRGGAPFVFYGLAMALQPVIDAFFLKALGTAEALGWYSVARKLIGLLLFPATALIGALYPTLSRLWVEDKEDFLRVTRGALHSVALLVMPMALGCALYPALGVGIFGKQSFGPSEDDLRVLALFLFLVYFTMPIGICVLAAGKQRAWSLIQCLCLVVSLVFDPLLTPWFEHKYKNGGLGPCVASVISELLVVAFGLWLMPRGVFDARFRRTLLFAVLSGGAMAAVAWSLRSFNPFFSAPMAVMAYGVGLFVTGEITRDDIAKLKGTVTRKLSRGR